MKSRPQNRTASATSADTFINVELADLIKGKTAEELAQLSKLFSESAVHIDKILAEMTGKPLVKRTFAPKIPKGFVMVNMSTWQQKRIRDWARECGFDLSQVFRWALTHMYCDLKARATIKRRTGWSLPEQRRFFDGQNDRN